MPTHVEGQRPSSYGLATLKAEKSNKFSTNFRPSPFKVVQKTGNEAGEEFRRNAAFIKKYNEQDGVSRPNGKEDSLSEEIGQRQEVILFTATLQDCRVEIGSFASYPWFSQTPVPIE